MRHTLFFITLILVSCEFVFIKEDVENTYVNNFEVFWEDFDKHYSFFKLKGIDWDSVYHKYRPQINNVNSDIELYSILEEIVLSLEDGHTNLYALNIVRYNFTEGFPENSPKFAQNYVVNKKKLNSIISYGDILNTDIGFIYISSFTGAVSEFEMINDIFSWVESKEKLIIDVRSNGGGSDLNALKIASKFAASHKIYRKYKFRNGQEHDSFTDWIEDSIEPSETIFNKPIAILTNRGSYSATEGFIASLKIFDNVITVGGISGGGTGNPMYRDLPNGWYFRLSSWVVNYTAFGVVENIGMIPDYPINITDNDIEIEKDAILEKAIELLE